MAALTLDDVAVVPEGLRVASLFGAAIPTRRAQARFWRSSASAPPSALRGVAVVGCGDGADRGAGVLLHQPACSSRGQTLDQCRRGIVQRRAALAGFDAEAFAGHSMQAGSHALTVGKQSTFVINPIWRLQSRPQRLIPKIKQAVSRVLT